MGKALQFINDNLPAPEKLGVLYLDPHWSA
jgi:hypothetical protein